MVFFKKNLVPIVITLVFGLIVSLLGTLYAQQNKKIEDKADKGEVVQMIQKLEAIREVEKERTKDERTEQKALNHDMLKTLQQLNLQIMLLNQQLQGEKNK